MAAVLLAVEGALVLMWKEPVTSFLQDRRQAALAGQLESAVVPVPGRVPATRPGGPPASPPAEPDPRELAAAARAWRDSRETGAPVARLRIPEIGVNQIVIEGTDPDELTEGPGHYPATALPGMKRTIAIAGHRTTWGAPFRHVDELRRGDPIELELPYGTFTFTVTGTRIVDDQDFSILDETGEARLVLTACHPLYAASQRIVVEARLDSASRRPTSPKVGSAPRAA